MKATVPDLRGGVEGGTRVERERGGESKCERGNDVSLEKS